jgi:hypothetical protein
LHTGQPPPMSRKPRPSRYIPLNSRHWVLTGTMEHRAGYLAACGRPGRGCGGLRAGWGLRGSARPGQGRKQAVRHRDPPRIPGTCGTLARKRGACQLCHDPALPSADDSGDDDRVTASACYRSSQLSQGIAGVTAGGEALRLSWLIHAPGLIGGGGVPPNHHQARINRRNVTEAADVSVGAPGPRLVAPGPRQRGARAHKP